MSLRIHSNYMSANVCGAQIRETSGMPEIVFAANPKGGTEALWFSFRIRETKPEDNQSGKMGITLRHPDLWGNPAAALDVLPVYRPHGQGWHRCSGGTLSKEPDGRFALSWLLPHPAPETEVALCFPYGPLELKSLMAKSKGYWKEDEVGRSEEGLPLIRWANEYGSEKGGKKGLYVIAREYAGETPGSWALEGMLQHMARIKRDPFLIWAIPFADPDALERGVHGKSGYPLDVHRAWTVPARRHEVLVYQRDIARWRGRCRPVLGLEFHASEPFDKRGVRCVLPSSSKAPEHYRAAEKWANVIRQELEPDYAAEGFKEELGPPPDTTGRTATEFFTENMEICALSLRIPYSRIGTKVLSQRHYREIGEAIAKALMKKGS